MTFPAGDDSGESLTGGCGRSGTGSPPMTGGLSSLLSESTRRVPGRVAVTDPARGKTITYADLEKLSDGVRDHLSALGVNPGDRVGLCAPKSIPLVASIFGVLKLGAVYVPVDPAAPSARRACILQDCSVEAVITDQKLVTSVAGEMSCECEQTVVPADTWPGRDPNHLICLKRVEHTERIPDGLPRPASALAYILYTSGSTGRPKGVALSQENAASFVDWCSNTFLPNEHDRFSSHAPLHFDLSVLDLFLPIKHGATVVLIGDAVAKQPAALVALIASEQLTIWYSTPSVLRIMLDHGDADSLRNSSLRYVLFAGEVFPVKHLRRLMQMVPTARCFNLYGPTETNVCTYHEIGRPIPEDRAKPFPIGRVCSPSRGRVVDPRDHDVPVGQTGELLIAGPTVMQGYWGLTARTSEVFLDVGSERWYRTGDLVVEEEDGVYSFVGRRDRMVKRRGFRIELGELENALYQHPGLSEVGVVATSKNDDVTITTFYSSHQQRELSLIELKRFCSTTLPLYMIPDRFIHLEALPKTSTDKLDYQVLEGLV